MSTDGPDLHRECPQRRRSRVSRSGLAASASLIAILVGSICLAYEPVGRMRGACVSKVDIARAMLHDYGLAYPRWREAHPGVTCPPDLESLHEYVSDERHRDPWGNLLAMTCDEHAKPAVRVTSSGPDGIPNTEDDLRSW